MLENVTMVQSDATDCNLLRNVAPVNVDTALSARRPHMNAPEDKHFRIQCVDQ